MNHEQLLVRGLAALDFDISESMIGTLSKYAEEIEKWNPLYGLVNAEGEDLIIKHVLDSLAPWRILEELLVEMDRYFLGDKGIEKEAPHALARVVDIGTGAGFPGIPLALAFPQRPFVLIERLEKRALFLENMVSTLDLKNVEIRQSTFENEREPLQCVVFRALKPFHDRKLFSAIWKRIQVGGALCAYKGKMLHAKIELAGLSGDPMLSSLAKEAQIVPVWVPFLEEERCIVIARKKL